MTLKFHQKVMPKKYLCTHFQKGCQKDLMKNEKPEFVMLACEKPAPVFFLHEYPPPPQIYF